MIIWHYLDDVNMYVEFCISELKKISALFYMY